MIVFLLILTLAMTYKLGHGAGEIKERSRHKQAVSEATENITSMRDWHK